MWYIDIEHKGEEYRGVYFTSYRPYDCGNNSWTDNTYQDDNGYNVSTVYWFKYEPISWTILNEMNGTAFILCDMIIDSQQYDYENRSYSSNYAESTIRAWLNETFLQTAFGAFEQSIIETTLVDNSAQSTANSSNRYICEDTSDKIFLLSYKEATNSAYGFSSDYNNNKAREKKTSDYAQAQGVVAYPNLSNAGSYAGNGSWWLRSPRDDYYSYLYEEYVMVVNVYGRCSGSGSADSTHTGVVPALWIRL